MKQRCENSSVPHYKRYGGKGVTVCAEWHDFINFEKWSLENGYDDTLTIDRIENSKGYSPENCRWVSNLIQQRNRKNNHLLTYNGETHCISEWSEILGISRSVITLRVSRYGYSVEEAFNKPVRRRSWALRL
jgi:hypothetical protein